LKAQHLEKPRQIGDHQEQEKVMKQPMRARWKKKEKHEVVRGGEGWGSSQNLFIARVIWVGQRL